MEIRGRGMGVREQGVGTGVQADRLLASSMRARAPWSRSRCSWRRRLAAPPWVPFSSSAISSSPFSSSDWRNSMGSCCSWSCAPCALALPGGFTLVVVGARCSRVRQYLRGQRSALTYEAKLPFGPAFVYVRSRFHLLRQPLRHSLVIHRLSLPHTLLWFLPLQTGERMLGAVSVSMREPIATSCRERATEQLKALVFCHFGTAKMCSA